MHEVIKTFLAFLKFHYYVEIALIVALVAGERTKDTNLLHTKGMKLGTVSVEYFQ